MDNPIYHPFLDPESPYYEGSTARDFSGTCPSYQGKPKTMGKGKKKKTVNNSRKCSLDKGHKGQHEYWQFPEEMTPKQIKNGVDIDEIHYEPWQFAMRTKTWGGKQ